LIVNGQSHEKNNAKIGIAAEALTGGAAILRRLSSQQWCLMVRQFPVDVSARHGDYPEGVPRDLGVEIDEARVREAARTAHAWRNPVLRGPDGGVREW
jgi:hypothetical protein